MPARDQNCALTSCLIEFNFMEMDGIPSSLTEKIQDPKEIRIRGLLKQELLSTTWAREALGKAKSHLKDFFKKTLVNPQEARQDYTHLLKDLAEDTHTKIVSGSENLQSPLLDKNKGVIVVLNHFGVAKMTDIDPLEVGLPANQLGMDEPFPMRHATVSKISGQMNRPIFETAGEQPFPINNIQKNIGEIMITYGQSGGLNQLKDAVGQTLAKNPTALMVMYPEGGTSGKWNGGRIYDLGDFKTGAFVIAAEFGLPVLPVCQYFNPNRGFELGILPPILIQKTVDRSYYQNIAKEIQNSMQQWLNSKKHSMEAVA